MKLFNRKEISHVLGVHSKTIETWEREEGLPVAVPGGSGGPGLGARYDVQEVVRWFANRETQKAIDRIVNDGDYDKDIELGRLRHHQADIASMESKRLGGELLDANEVGEAWINIIMEARAALLALPLRVAQTAYSGASMREIESSVRVEVEDVLNKLANNAVYVPEVDEEVETDLGSQSPAENV